MNLNVFTVTFLLLPGLICAVLVAKLTTHRELKPVEFLIPSFIYGFLIYLCYGRLSMNKSRFSARIGMKPQTYNNFIGPQGSKPNIELLLGMLNVYHVNPYWLLNGTGEIFLESSPDRE